MPNSNIIIWTPIIRCGSKNGYQKDICSIYDNHSRFSDQHDFIYSFILGEEE